MSKYINNDALFDGSYFRRVIADPGFPRQRELPADGRQKLQKLLEIWHDIRPRLVQDLKDSDPLSISFAGLPPTVKPLKHTAEAVVENDFIIPVLEDILNYSCDKQKTLLLDGLPEKEKKKKKNDRPDIILFRDKKAHNSAVKKAGKKSGTALSTSFCRDADFILDAKKFEKGIGSDEDRDQTRDTSAAADIEQIDRYIRGCGKKWGILTNGRCWRLMRAGKKQEHLRFDLVMFLEDLLNQEGVLVRGRINEKSFTNENLEDFALFYYFFGHPAVGGGYLDIIYNEGEANNRRVSDILRDNAYKSVQMIAQGFWQYKGNGFPEKPPQNQLDNLRELSLTFLYRLLFLLKAEAQKLLPMQTAQGAESLYAKAASTKAIFFYLQKFSSEDLKNMTEGFNRLKRLFELVNSGGDYEVPAYDGGLFDTETHAELEQLRLNDHVVYEILNKLIYLDESEPVPYADLDVRDFGDIYEGLLEQRLILEKQGQEWTLSLKNKKGERKASGSYFTPDSLVDHIVRETITPLMEKCKRDPNKILSLKILDPAMGSGHFLVKVVDIMAWHLTLNCAPIDKGVPNDNGPNEYAYWKRKVVESSIYGVDVNPMAVELAKVALWLHTASLCKPLSFLDHHLKCGNSLVGADLRHAARPGLESRELNSGTVWQPVENQEIQEDIPAPKTKKKKRQNKQLDLPFPINTELFSGILESVSAILKRPSSTPADIKSKHRDYFQTVNFQLESQRLLCDLWCAQWFLSQPDKKGISIYESPNGLYTRLKKICGLTDDAARAEAVEKIKSHWFIKKVETARKQGYGPRPMRFFHWQIEFPEAAFTEHGELKPDFGFDAVVGNPPWDKIKSAKRDFYGAFNEEVADSQGTSLNALISEMEKENPTLITEWEEYEKMTVNMTTFLTQCNFYKHQTAVVDGRKTGGDPDLFRYFTERAGHFTCEGGRVGLVVPCTLWQGQGCTGLRRFLFEKCTISSIYTFENYRKWAFGIHSSFKFTAFTFIKQPPSENHSFKAAFMLRDSQILEGLLKERIVMLSAYYIKAVSPSSLALIDNKSDGEARFMKKIHQDYPVLGSKESGWNPVYIRELDMTNDSWRFKTREWMKDRGFTQVLPKHQPDGTWSQEKNGPYTAILPNNLPKGGEYWISADPDWYKQRGYIEKQTQINNENKTFFIYPDEADLENSRKIDSQKDYRRIFPSEIYTALYEGRMINIFDHSQKRYLRGEGRKAIWEDIPISEKMLQPRVFVCKMETGKDAGGGPRIGFCDITGATNERSILASVLGQGSLAGHKVPCLKIDSYEKTFILTSIMCSFCSDMLMRMRISTNLTLNFLSNLAIPRYSDIPQKTKLEICRLAAKLNCTTPELSEAWNTVFPDNPWTYESAERDLWKRAEIRARLDAIAADLYGLTVEEYAQILTGFPLLDRDQPTLPGDFFLTEGSEKSKENGRENENWIETGWGIFELKPRSFITRDFALKTYMEYKNYAKPQKLDEWYKDKVNLDPEGSLSRFRIGKIKDLIERVEIAKNNGAVPYYQLSIINCDL
ncbi:Putative SAM-dependent DNA methylase, adenine-specific [Desulfonema limicola]|uniref:site-specific DNA-methyltransferase (adenine-specific) n=1 Tax=Desulfonema limicola TaxID=45656 RepID=A0A975B3R7_9BACT|nr:N-6 DNA methylase [Desulfonema limicola]QTA78233.1 Putative SAM-dependent DNA methylase, adenine-specific [Desulfonema limicola]